MGTGQGCTLTTFPREDTPEDRGLADKLYRLSVEAARRVRPNDYWDLGQVIRLEVIEKWADFDPTKASLATWIGQIAFRRNLDLQRGKGREDRQLDQYQLNLEIISGLIKRRPRGNVAVTESQKFGIAEMCSNRNWSPIELWRAMGLEKALYKVLSFKRRPSHMTIYRAVAWAREQNEVAA